MHKQTLWLFLGLLSLAHCVQNNGSENNNNYSEQEENKNEISSRSGKAINFFPESSSADSPSDRQQHAAARRVRFGDDDDSSQHYVTPVTTNDIGNSYDSEERRPVFAYKRPDDGSVYQSDPNPNVYSRPYEYQYNNQGQYSQAQPSPTPNYYAQQQSQGNPNNYYNQYSQNPPPSSPPPVSQTYHHIPYQPTQSYPQQQHQQQYPKQQQQYPSYRPQYQQQFQRPPPGPYYQQHPQRPPPPPQYSPNYPYQSDSGVGGGLLGNLGSLFSGNGAGGGGGASGLGAVGGQFGYAIENIVRFDDYQCVPKIVCQMVGNPQRQATLPGWLNAPSLTALISAVPSTSPMLVFGRAALLGLSGGENHCDSSYPRCPRNEDDVLNYLNNHRGGFFRFFNGGASYGDESDYGYDQQQPQYDQQQYQQQQYQQQQPIYQQSPPQPAAQSPLAGLDLGTIQSFAEAINSGGGINLSNLGSNLGLLGNLASLGSALGSVANAGAAKPTTPPKQTAASSLGSNLSLLSNLGSQLGLGNTVSNLLTGIVGARFAGRKARKLSKRSTDLVGSSLDEILLSLGDEESTTAKSSDGPSKKRNLNQEIGDDASKLDNVEKVGLQKRKKYHQDMEKKEKIRSVEKLLGIQARIINKEEIQAEAEDRIVNGNVAALHSESLQLHPIFFPDNNEPPLQVNHDHPQQLIAHAGPAFTEQNFREHKQIPSTFVFPSGGFQSGHSLRGGKAFAFSQSSPIQPSAHQINVPFNQLQFPEAFQNSDGIILDIPKPLPLEYYDRTKMIFPDRTGTGNLRFDNDHFEPQSYAHNQIRIGRILTGVSDRPVSYQGSYNENHGTSSAAFSRGDVLIFHSNRDNKNNNYNQPQFDFGNRYPLTNNQVNSNRYQATTPSQLQSQNNYYNRYGQGNNQQSNNRDTEQKVYVTNGQGVVTYYLNARGEKIAV